MSGLPGTVKMQSLSMSSFGAVFCIESLAFGILYCCAMAASRSLNSLYTSVYAVLT